MSRFHSKLDLVLVVSLFVPPGIVLSDSEHSDIAPAWYALDRVHAHTRLQLRDMRRFEKYVSDPGERARALGAAVLTRHIKSGDETPLWQTQPEKTSLQRADQREETPELLTRTLAAAHSDDVRTIAYYWHMSDQRVLEQHPDWACRDYKGRLQAHHRKGAYLDITGPYKELVLKDLLHAAAAGADGFFFDNRHLPQEGCWGSHLEAAYRQRFGAPAPNKPSNSPEYLQWLHFRAAQIEATFRYWVDGVRERYPDAVLLISTRALSALTLPETTTQLASLAPAKTEYELALKDSLKGRVFKLNPDLAVPAHDVQLAAGWAVLRDAGAPPHVWIVNAPNEEHALGAVASVIAHGGIANVDVSEEVLLGRSARDYQTAEQALRAAFALGNRVSPAMEHATPLRWAAVHFSESIRDRHWPDYRQAWTDVLWPFIGAYGVLLHNRVPVGVINDQQLAGQQLDQYGVLVLTSPDALSEEHAQAVKAFRQRGGVVIENEPRWGWHVRGKNLAARAAFLQKVEPLFKDAPIRVLGGPEGLHAVAFERIYDGAREWLIALTPDFSWVQIQSSKAPLESNEMHAAPAPVTAGVTIELHESLTRGRDVADFAASEVISGRDLEVASRGGQILVSMPEFRNFALCLVRESGANK